MKKFLIVTGYIILSVVIILYGAFLIVPPFMTSYIDKFKPDIQKLVKDNSKLNLDYSKIRLFTTPLLSAGIIVEDAKITLPDESELLSSPRIKAGIALPSLLTLTIKTSKCYIDNPSINFEIVNDEQYKLVKVIEDIINENNAKPKEETTEENSFPIDLSKITIKVPSVKIKEFVAKVNDLKSSHSLTLKGDELELGYNSKSNTISVKTNAKLYSDDSENINANIAIKSSLPNVEKDTEEVDPEEKIQIPFVNIVKIYQTYDLKTNIVSKLDVKNTPEHGFIAFGFLNVDNLTLKLSDIQLPESFLHSKFTGKKIKYESDIYAKNDEKISLQGLLKYGKNPKLYTTILSDEIHFTNLLALLKGLLDSLNIKNDIASISASGFLKADATIRTDFKKLTSTGSIIVKDGSFVNDKFGIGIKDVIANLIFDNNTLNIKDTSAIINGSKLTANGMIDNNSNVDIKLDVNNLSIPSLYKTFAPRELKKEYLINSALLSAHINIKGKLDNLNAKLKTTLTNLNLCDARKTMYIANNVANIDFTANANDIKGEVDNSGFLFNIPSMKTTAKIDKLFVNIDKNNITLKPFDLLYNNFSKINIKGQISNYMQEPNIDMLLSGNLATSNIKQTLGRDIAHYFDSKGTIPAKVTVKGDAKTQNVVAQIYSDRNNYITPINLNVLTGAPALINAEIKLHNNKIKIKNSGLYKKASVGFSDNLENNMQGAVQLADLTAIIDNSHINLLRINIPKDLSGSIALFKKSSFKTKGKINITGNFDDLSYGGDLKVWDINIPEIKTKVKNLDLNLGSKSLTAIAKEINLNSSKLDGSMKVNLTPSSILKLNDINIDSDYIDVDKALVVTEDLMKYLPQSSGGQAGSAADIPILADGRYNIKKIKSGNIDIHNIKGNLEIKKNNLHLNKLSCKAFQGDISGNIIVNLISQLITVKVKGSNVDLDEMLVKAANMKDTMTGKTSFETNLSLKGATYEQQVKSMLGTVKFEAKNGVYGPFSKLENFFLAENIRENPIFSNTIGVILTPLTTINSSRYDKLTGTINFKDGIANLESIKSQGDILCVLIKGKMNLLTNVMESNVRVRLASAVSDMLGPLAVANPVNLVKKTPGLNIMTAQLFKIFTQVVLESEYKEIPDFSLLHSDANATKFQIVLRGDVAKPLKLVKSFKWLALQADMDKAESFSKEYIKEQQELAKQELVKKLQTEYEENNKVKVGVEKVLQMDTTAPAVKQVLVEEVIRNVQTKKTENATSAENLEKIKQEAKEQVKEAAAKKAKEQINTLQEKIKAEKEAKAKAEAEAKAKAEAEAKAKEEAAQKAKEEAEAKQEIETKSEEQTQE